MVLNALVLSHRLVSQDVKFLFSYFVPLFIWKRDLLTAALLSPLFMLSTSSTTEPAQQRPLLLHGEGGRGGVKRLLGLKKEENNKPM